MDRSKCVFAVCASGDRHETYKRHLLKQLGEFVPGVDVLDLDVYMAGDMLAAIPEKKRSYFVRLAIPFMERFRKYERVVWLDVDVDIVSPKFASILDVETSGDGIAMSRDLDRVQSKMRKYLKGRFPEYNKSVFFNSGVMVMDLQKIDLEKWRSRVELGIKAYLRDNPPYHDQDILNAFFDIAEIDCRYNAPWLDMEARRGAWLVHYIGSGGKGPMDQISGFRKCVFAVSATGERFERFKKNLVDSMSRYVPFVDVVDVDPSKIGFLEKIPDDRKAQFVRLAIPLMEEFRKYDRVVWVDADAEVVSPEFGGILGVETSDDGLAAVRDREQGWTIRYLKSRFPKWRKSVYFNSGVLVIDIGKVDVPSWTEKARMGIEMHVAKRFPCYDQDIFNGLFDIKEIIQQYNSQYCHRLAINNDVWLLHYLEGNGKDMLDEVVSTRAGWHRRCVVVMPRHEFIRPWIRAYFASGNRIPLVIATNKAGNWTDSDMAYCRAAAQYSGGIVLDCTAEWVAAEQSRKRSAGNGYNIGWYTKKHILHSVAVRLAPESWMWLDDDIELTGNLDECFDFAERSPGFICSHFYRPHGIDHRHPASMYRSKRDRADKLCWGSMVIFHGAANYHLTQNFYKSFPVEDDEMVYASLYASDSVWHDGFYDFSHKGWQCICKLMDQIPKNWSGKALHYAAQDKGNAVKKYWARKADEIPAAPFEKAIKKPEPHQEPVDAVFVIGTGSMDCNEELRYALRSLDKNCKFVRDVYICGTCPAWVDRSKVKFLPWDDRFQHAKDANIVDKLRHACEHKGIAKKILFCSDDQFQTRACKWEDFAPRYLMEFDPGDKWYDEQRRIWHTRLRNTLLREMARRKAMGMPGTGIRYFQPHIWMPMDRDVFLDYAKWCGYETREDTIIASGYYNFANTAGVPNFDHVFLDGSETEIPKVTHVAYQDCSYRAAIKILKALFPDPSRFEIHKDTAKPAPAPATTQQKASNEGYDPSPATGGEMSEIIEVSSNVRANPELGCLLGEISRAEELRLFGVRGWRIVWRDIVMRFDSAGKGIGTNDLEPRSKEAQDVVNAYISNPEAMSTVTFDLNSHLQPSSRDRMRERVRASLRTKAQ